MRTTVPRLNSVRFKDGRPPIRVIHPQASIYPAALLSSAQSIATARPDMAGYVIIAWSRDGGTSTDCGSAGAPVPLMMLPEVAKMCVADFVATLTAEPKP